MINDNIICLMSGIMQVGMTIYQIERLFKEAFTIKNILDIELPPAKDNLERKEFYASKILNQLKERGYEDTILYIANQLIYSEKYYKKDKEHPYPKRNINKLEKILYPDISKQYNKNKKDNFNKKLRYINNKELRKLIKEDLNEINICISNKAWKSAVVLSGGVIEAILYDWLSLINNNDIKDAYYKCYQKAMNKKLNKLSFSEYIDITSNLGLLSSLKIQLTDVIRNYRNLIHPDVNLRKNIRADESIAKISIDYILGLLEERKNYLKNNKDINN